MHNTREKSAPNVQYTKLKILNDLSDLWALFVTSVPRHAMRQQHITQHIFIFSLPYDVMRLKLLIKATRT